MKQPHTYTHTHTHTHTRFKLILYFCLGLFVLNACTLEEDVIHQHKRDEKIKIERQSFNELMKTNQFSRAMRKVPKKRVQVTNSLGRTQMEEQYAFTIVDTPVKIIEFEGKTTYTIQIIKDDNADNKIENLVLYQTPIDDKIGYIVKYNSEMGTLKTEEEISEDGISELETLTSTGTLTQKTTIYVVYLVASCILKPGDPSYCGGDSSNPNFTSACQSYYYDVIAFGGGGDISGNADGDDTSGPVTGSGEGGGGSGNGDNPEPEDPTVIPNHGATSPLNCGTCPTLESEVESGETPCETLKKLTDPTKPYNIIPKLGTIRSQIDLNPNGENGVSFQVNDGVRSNVVLPSSSESEIDIPTTSNTYGGAHTHPDKLNPVFSWNDIFILRNFYRKGNQVLKDDAVYILVAENETTQAIKITDIDKLETFLLKWLNNPKYAGLDKDKKAKRISEDFNKEILKKAGVSNNHKLGFLNAIKDIGVSLFTLNEANGQWTELTVASPTSSNYTTNPCTN